MTQPKTTLVPGVPWPEVGEWPTRFTHAEKPKRVIKPKAKAVDLCEAKVKKGVFQHPVQAERKPAVKLVKSTTLDSAFDQIAKGDIKSKHKHAVKNLKRPDLAPKEFFIFSKARSYK